MLTRIQIHSFTSKTYEDYFGKAPTRKEPVSIHPYGRRKKDKVTCTEPPRTRAGKTYPGGRYLRRRLTRLEMRRKMREDGIQEVKRDRPGIVEMHKNVPGSMTH